MKGKVWPYILPLPLDESYSLLSLVFSSNVSVDILRLVALTDKVYQKELIERLKKYSNKTVIEKLKRLVASKVLREGMEKKRAKGKTVWVKWYEPTFLGRWLALLLLPPKMVSREEAEKIVTELFKLYVSNVVRFCQAYDIDPDKLKTTFQEAFKVSSRS